MDTDTLAQQVGAALLAQGWTMSAAESCTGGLVLHRLTNIPGSSAYVIGGVVAYANAVKIAQLDVPETTLIAHGAVSEQTAEAMARGALVRFGTTIAVSITGIAGPGGGTPEKPVGLAYIGAALRRDDADPQIMVERHFNPGEREYVKAMSADAALRLLLRLIDGA